MYIDEVLKFADILIDYVRHVTTEIDALFADVLSDNGLTILQSRVLTEVRQARTLTIGALAEALKLNKANVSNMCKKLAQAGFLNRFRDKNDERVVLVSLTEKGEETLKEIDRVIQGRYAQVIENTPPEDFEALQTGMDTIEALLARMHEANQNRKKEELTDE
ncbi:MarR family transcriptional regulator [Eubacterium sp. 1001713B170207_170306_E7]|uniref:MarR family winged helix-turn-helix transcriptional regulator n=1 Tax=Eubacterium sp. 1001713B170207_170306_E7 TaxID=2787097 RepID=UPI00189ADE0C|nr:MarR family transcriptional regulator [Eubacterium sp. 1001713B170207_170306_E7]